MTTKGFIVAIDGPAGAGKSTVAKESADKLKFEYLDTGAMYRALAWCALRDNIDLEDTKSLKSLINSFNIEMKMDSKGNSKLFFDGQDITEEVRRPVVSQAVSYVADDLDIRYFLVNKQRELAMGKKCVLEGRDIGTYVFPDADIKFFLTASLDVRVKRRLNELKEKDYAVDYNELRNELIERDQKDKNRKVGALKQAPDSIILDTTNMNLREVVDSIVDKVFSKYRIKTLGE